MKTLTLRIGQAMSAEDILVPMVSWDLEGGRLNRNQADVEQSLEAIKRFSIFQVLSKKNTALQSPPSHQVAL